MKSFFKSRSLIVVGSLLIAACGLMPAPRQVLEPQPVAPQTPVEPVATHLFKIADDDDVIGELQITHATADDTLSDIARRFNLGYEELVRANPGVDPWLPGAGREIVLPTQFVLPNAPREGLVVNLAALRVFYFPKRKPGELQTVITHPIGIGKVGWVTPEGVTKVISKKRNPVWVPPVSVRKEHAENGDPLPKVVPPGDDNPLGAFAMTLSWPGYLIHGTNKPYGVGMRSSHGCMRFYPEDIALLFDEIPIGAMVQVVNQRVVSGWHAGKLYVQVMPPPEEESESESKPADKKAVAKKVKEQKPLVEPFTKEKAIARLFQQAKQHAVVVDQSLLDQVIKDQTNVSYPVTGGMTTAQVITSARHVDNHLPKGATWDGSTTLMVTAEEFDAMRSGVILPKKEAAATEPPKKSEKPSSASPKAKSAPLPAT
ncbi:MAG TPA: L,D-transpeptidase family protein [Steroidobacteraceae bacterium]|nr:L,D-transpeptidase family protein [Steroidobacteraceae bacterium]